MRTKTLSLSLVLGALTFLPHPGLAIGEEAATRACTSLRSSLGTTIVQSSGVGYQAAANNTWNLFNAQFQPTCIVFPRTANDVQVAMKGIYHANAHYAVQGGGHSAMKGWNSVENGVLILFSNMTDVSYNAKADSITLQPGVHWDDAITKLAPQGVAPVGGRQGDVGMGLLLGGGLSFLSPAHGFAADSFKELDVVLVTGEIVTATATNTYADLFRALKGGANRFGIVTRYEVYAVHTGTAQDKNWYGGMIVYSNSSVEAVLNATAHYVRDTKDPKAVLLTAIVNVMVAGVITPAIAVNTFYNGPELPTSIFGEFLAIPAATTILGPLSYSDVTTTLPAGNERGNGQHFGASALIGDESLYLNAFKSWSNFTTTFKDDLSLSVLAFTPVLQPQILAGRARGGNAISPPDGGYAAVQLAQTLPSGITKMNPRVEQGIQQLFAQIPPSPGKPLFMNECNANQNVFETYGDIQFLKQTYAKYDPTRFNMKHTQGPMGL